ncbi:MAG: hypothetical protein EBU82_11355, partial [Flavobacteriia bacterium]|nr:hypothetical protein [Flavobacteriia bacterium]
QFAANKFGVALFRVDEIETHGGSHRYWLGASGTQIESSVGKTYIAESKFGLLELENHKLFGNHSRLTIANFDSWLRNQKEGDLTESRHREWVICGLKTGALQSNGRLG